MLWQGHQAVLDGKGRCFLHFIQLNFQRKYVKLKMPLKSDKVLSVLQVVGPSRVYVRGRLLIYSPPDGKNVQRAGNPKEEFQYGNFEYCF